MAATHQILAWYNGKRSCHAFQKARRLFVLYKVSLKYTLAKTGQVLMSLCVGPYTLITFTYTWVFVGLVIRFGTIWELS